MLDKNCSIFYIKLCKNKFSGIVINPGYISFDNNSKRFVIIIPTIKLGVKNITLLGLQKTNFYCAEGQLAQSIPYGFKDYNDNQLPTNNLKNCLTYLIDFKSLKTYSEKCLNNFYNNPFSAFNIINDNVSFVNN